jgi:hypothetical protein
MMKKWSDKLIEISKEYLNYDGTHVKSLKGDFGVLNINYEKQTYKIISKSSNQTSIFNSIDEMINAGWAVD